MPLGLSFDCHVNHAEMPHEYHEIPKFLLQDFQVTSTSHASARLKDASSEYVDRTASMSISQFSFFSV